MKKSKLLAAALAATMFTTAACALVACGDDGSNFTGDNGYIVSFNAAGGVLNGAEALYTDKEGVVKGTIPTAEKEDTTFKGWALTIGADESAVINFSTYKFEKDKTVYAVYKAYDVVTISYDYGEGIGTRAADTTVNGKLVNLPIPTTPAGKKFDGWFTASSGGTMVTTDTVFTQNVTVYAQYSDESTDYINYGLVGDKKFELKEVTIEDAAQAFSATVNLQANDVVSFYVGGQLISATGGGIWIGMKPSIGKKTEFVAERSGTFEFTLSCAAGVVPAWTLTGDDGTIVAIKNDYYLIGEGAEFGDWKCLEKWHLGSSSGSVDVTVGATTPATFKVVKAADRIGTPNWGGGFLGVDAITVGAGYADTDKDDNIVLKVAGTYTIALVGGEIEITSDLPEPQPIAVKGDYYIVGLGAEYGAWANCLEKWHFETVTDDDVTTYEIEFTLTSTPATFKIVKCNNAYTGGFSWNGTELGIGAVTTGRGYASTDNDKNIVLKTAGTYTITLEGGKVKISADFAEPEPTKDVDGYTYGAVDSSKYYLVGGFIGEAFDGEHGYEMKLKDNGEWMVEGFTVEAGGAVKIVIGGEEYGYDNVHEIYGNKSLAETDDDGNIVFKAAGTYSIFINPTTHDIYLS